MESQITQATKVTLESLQERKGILSSVHLYRNQTEVLRGKIHSLYLATVFFTANKRAISSCFTASSRSFDVPLHSDDARLVTLLMLLGTKSFYWFLSVFITQLPRKRQHN